MIERYIGCCVLDKKAAPPLLAGTWLLLGVQESLMERITHTELTRTHRCMSSWGLRDGRTRLKGYMSLGGGWLETLTS